MLRFKRTNYSWTDLVEFNTPTYVKFCFAGDKYDVYKHSHSFSTASIQTANVEDDKHIAIILYIEKNKIK